MIYVVSFPGRQAVTLDTADEVADLVIGDDRHRHKETLVNQLLAVSPGQEAYLTSGIRIQVMEE